MQIETRFRELLNRYVAGTSTPRERAIMEEWFEKGGDTSKADLHLSADDKARLLGNIHRSQNNKSVPEAMPIRGFGWLSGWRAAAIWIGVMITAGAGILTQGTIRQLFTNTQAAVYDNKVTTGKGEIKKVLLPDSSVVLLNANSSLTYQSDFATHRQLQLTGEAMFTVTHHKEHPFTVQTPDSVSTTVLGTQFNINCYTHSEDVHIAVVAGRVKVSQAGKILDTLTIAQAIRYHKASRNFTVYDDVSTESITSWIKGEWEYENLRFSDLEILLHNQYGITLTNHQGTKKLQTRVSVNFNNGQSASEIMEVFCSFAGCRFRIISPSEIEVY